ncbi:DEAD/DEAH box helicase family protein [Candidatus Spongiihabitans sp.]|uniref:DEAD/DEAH box helicase family protein n=1 Tax=Candidatus Spongiihabitans sp. TaxID=3101308 RepID=UPI003C6F1A8E
MQTHLELISESLNYGDLPETWRVPDIHRFSSEKTLYGYQTDALEKAARAFYLYYGKDHDWFSGETQETSNERKRFFMDLYRDSSLSAYLKKYETRADEKNKRESQVFRLLSEFMRPLGDLIPYANLINRMCFWMATGSGKTLVMVKLIEYLRHLQQHGEIPPHNILILAPSSGGLIGQIRRTIDEFNRSSGLQIDLVPLRQAGRGSYQHRVGDSIVVYYHRSDNISDVQKEALIDYRTYENGGKWFILLDEAHKGSKEDSKRQAYYAIMAREGFLFNFSATFTDKEDIITTVKKYNLEEFVKNGHGKNIYLNETEYNAFKNRKEEISHAERRKIVLKSLITLAYVSMRVKALRIGTGLENLYHLPLMLTLVNSVNTDIENDQNDLWAFFQTLREIATGEIDQSLFKEAKTELMDNWRNARLLFGGNGAGIIGTDEDVIGKMKITDLREAVFLSRAKGALQFIRSEDNKELAFQLKNADSPFALIRIGDTSKWRNILLDGFEETTALQGKSFFEGLEKSRITILMGSRSFFESWDSNRPNVINFINIGGKDAKKFVVQSVGRGVRIEPLPNQRRRFARLPESNEKKAIQPYHDQVQPLETLFLFATNRSAVKAVLEGLAAEYGESGDFEILEGFERAPIPKIGNKNMPLLVPEYKEAKDGAAAQGKFAMSEKTLNRLKSYMETTSDAVFAVRDGLKTSQIAALRSMVKNTEKIQLTPEKNYAMIPFLQHRLISHLSKTAKVSDGVRALGKKDIVHFRHIRVHSEYVNDLKERLNRVRQGEVSDGEISKLGQQLGLGEITREEFTKKSSGKNEETFRELTIKRVAQHYYFPVLLGNETTDYIQHIIKVNSEVSFLNALEKWVERNKVPWDAWMFSKIDESLDDVHIPYYDRGNNDYRRFLPDFVFWMCKGNEYRIVFVDPKGTEYTAAERRIDGYKELFEEDEKPRFFRHGKAGVQVKLFMFNDPQKASGQYRRYWTEQPGDIFRVA